MSTLTPDHAVEYLTERLYSELDYARELSTKLDEETEAERRTGVILAWSRTGSDLRRALRTISNIRSTIGRLRAETEPVELT